MNEESIASIAKSLSIPDALPSQNFYSLLTAFSIFLQTKPSARGGRLAKATDVGYMSQVVNLLRERYPLYLSDSKRIAKIRDKMGSTIEERNLLAGSLHDATVLTLMWHTFGRAIDTCFARKSQLSMAISGELFLHLARIKTSVVQGISIYKAATHWEQCMLHSLGMLFVRASEPSSYVFPLVPHAAASDLPGEKTYSHDEAILYWENLEEKAEPRNEREPPTKRASSPLPPTLTAGLSSHSLRRGSAAYANASPQLAIQWISTRGAWLLDSLTKAFAYVGTTTREDQSPRWIPRPAPAMRHAHDCHLERASSCARVRPAANPARPALQERQQLHGHHAQR
ncbi:hypothetical protein PHYSODRAFT_500802 [Phytophthora sojae]|uniref:Uncharacterized protein n=1 Tax=Phytophthora sojae (strain P6497) TaxID=1094619 RepID=G4ZE73_PHYSP|nr:hypothetical protein PHYSODRAFT_500802 [Phytophthora sojae]EGZ17424.1 hypothetical protein PHYSODRAFT_500802 [Phytophthora sojae]|eukprot:XP_009526482.1 hypothetical protein PHYSODRAFT_500802 [Phytophthora sojae]